MTFRMKRGTRWPRYTTHLWNTTGTIQVDPGSTAEPTPREPTPQENIGLKFVVINLNVTVNKHDQCCKLEERGKSARGLHEYEVCSKNTRTV